MFPKRASGARMPCRTSKRRRLPAHAPPWASLPQDLVELIGWRVLAGDLRNYVRFRAVCSHWNSSTARPHGRGLADPRFHPRQWMLFPEGHGLYPGHPHLGGYVRFFSRSTWLVRVHLPLFEHHVVLDSTDGLLLLHRHPDTAIRLLHPFTGEIAELPPMLTLLPQMEPRARRSCFTGHTELRDLDTFLRGICAAVTITATGAISVMLALDVIQIRRVAYATAGDKQWTVSAWEFPTLLTRSVSFQGKLYATSLQCASYQDNHKSVSYQGDDNVVYIYQIDQPQPNGKGIESLTPPVIIAQGPLVDTMDSVNLVECDSELMLIGYRDNSYLHLVVYRLNDLIGGKIAPLKNIGEHALFLGERGVCVSANKGLPSVMGNTIIRINSWSIYYTEVETDDPRQPRSRVEEYHLSSGTWSPAMDGDILCTVTTPASPYALAHHIFTCCFRGYWNKGYILCAAIIPNWSMRPNLRIEG